MEEIKIYSFVAPLNYILNRKLKMSNINKGIGMGNRTI